VKDAETANRLNERLLENVNATGKIYLTHTKLNGTYTLRMVIGQTNVTLRHVEKAWKLLQQAVKTLR
jgi:aromatic-L-amino-acid decarboxylase